MMHKLRLLPSRAYVSDSTGMHAGLQEHLEQFFTIDSKYKKGFQAMFLLAY